MSAIHLPSLTRRRRRTAAIAIAAGISAALILSSCASSASTAKKPDLANIVVATPALPTAYAADNTGGLGSTEAVEYQINTNANLVRAKEVKNEFGQLQESSTDFEGVLAKDWDVSADGLTYTFHLKQGVMSQAGNELDANDVVWSFERKFKASTSVLGISMAPIITDPGQVTATGKYDVAIKIGAPGDGVTLLSLLNNCISGIYDSDALKAHVTAADPYAVTWSNDNPNIGYGAYYRDSYTAGQQLVLTANPNYVLGKPAITKITYLQATDAGLRANSLKAGDVTAANQIRPSDQADLTADGKLQSFTTTIASKILNVNLNTRTGIFTDQKLREAFAYAVPYDDIIKTTYAGRAVKINGVLDAQAGYSDKDVPGATYDPAKAKSLLAAAGYTAPVAVKITVSSALQDITDTAVQIQAQAKAAGFDVSVQTLAPADYAAQLAAGNYVSTLARGGTNTRSPYYVLGYQVQSKFGWVPTQAYLDALKAGHTFANPTDAGASAQWQIAVNELGASYSGLRIAIMQPFTIMNAALTGYEVRADVTTDWSRIS